MPRGKPFICWLGRYNETALYIGDECEYQNSDEWIKGKIGCKRNGSYVFRVSRKEYPVYMICQLRGADARE